MRSRQSWLDPSKMENISLRSRQDSETHKHQEPIQDPIQNPNPNQDPFQDPYPI